MQEQMARGTAPDLDTATLAGDIGSPSAKLVYLYLDTVDGGTVEDLHEALGMRRMDLFGVLDSLSAGGHVSREGRQYVCC
jgi:DNA-binding MarR family transcriptional regulator